MVSIQNIRSAWPSFAEVLAALRVVLVLVSVKQTNNFQRLRQMGRFSRKPNLLLPWAS